MLFNDRRKTRVQSAKERSIVHNVANTQNDVLWQGASRKERYARAAQALDTTLKGKK
jgi:hypothetical protein